MPAADRSRGSVHNFRWSSRRGHDSYEQLLLNFVHRLLEGRLLAPIEQRAVLVWRETAERIGRMYARGILLFLTSNGGWQQRRYVVGERLVTSRIWDCPAFEALELRFGEAAIRLSIELFEALSRNVGSDVEPETKAVKACVKRIVTKGSATESLLLYLMARPLALTGSLPSLVGELARGNGRIQATIGVSPTFPIEVDKAALLRMFQEWGWTLPWLSGDLARWWVREDEQRFSAGLAHYQRVLKKLSTRFDVVLELAREHGRPDWSLPLLDYFCQTCNKLRRPEDTTEALEYMIESETHQMRQHYRDEWGRLLRTAGSLLQLRRQVRRRHPVDREPSDKMFLAAWKDRNFDGVLEKVEQLRIHLERVL